MCKIVIPLELLMSEDLQSILDTDISSDKRIIKTDDNLDVLILSDCTIDTIIELLDLCPYLVIQKNFDDYVHTGVKIDIDLSTDLNFNSEDML